MSDEKRERGLVCLFCGEGFGYAGQTPDDATLQAACDHEAQCPRNPYKAEIKRLRDALGVIARNVDARAVHISWCSDYAKRVLANAPDQARLQPSTEAGCSPFKYIPNWQTLDLKCTVCGTTKSVKYRMVDGKVRCNLCVGKANKQLTREN